MSGARDDAPATPALSAGTPWSERRFQGVVFDLDGTLVDSYVAIAASVNAARRRLGLPPVGLRIVRAHVGRGLEALMRDLVGSERASEAVRLFRAHYAHVYREGTRLLPGVREAVRRLAAEGYSLAVASNKPARFGRAILERLGLGEIFATIEGPDTSGATKPDPAMLERCLEILRIPASRCLYVGDMPLDVETAARARMEVVLVPTGSATRAELERTGKPVLARLDQLPAWLAEAGREASAPLGGGRGSQATESNP